MLARLKKWISEHKPVFKKTADDAVRTAQNLMEQEAEDIRLQCEGKIVVFKNDTKKAEEKKAREHGEQLKRIQAEHQKQLESLKRITDELAKTSYHRIDVGTYELRLSFSPRLFRGVSYPEDQWLIAEHVASRVKQEIGSSKFVRMADELEVQRRRAFSPEALAELRPFGDFESPLDTETDQA